MSQQRTPVQSIPKVPSDKSSADFIRHVLMTCGKKDRVVSVAASRPSAVVQFIGFAVRFESTAMGSSYIQPVSADPGAQNRLPSRVEPGEKSLGDGRNVECCLRDGSPAPLLLRADRLRPNHLLRTATISFSSKNPLRPSNVFRDVCSSSAPESASRSAAISSLRSPPFSTRSPCCHSSSRGGASKSTATRRCHCQRVASGAVARETE